SPPAGTATHVGGGFRNVRAFVGGAGNDRFDILGGTQPTSGSAAAGTATTLTDAHASFPTDEDGLSGMTGLITARRGQGQKRVIASNTAQTITVASPWLVAPDATSQYRVIQDVTAVGGPGNDVFAISDWLGLATLDGSGGTNDFTVNLR